MIAKIIKYPIGNMLDTKTTVFKIVNLDGSEIDSLPAENTFYTKKKEAIKYLDNINNKSTTTITITKKESK